MTTDALERLIRAVETGTATEFQFLTWRPGLSGTRRESQTMMRSYGGSLNAARDLHDAMLPGWKWGVSHEDPSGKPYSYPTFWVQSPDRASRSSFFRPSGMTPLEARSWLLAILRAKLAEANNSTPRNETAV